MKTRSIFAGLVAAALSLGSISSFAHGFEGDRQGWRGDAAQQDDWQRRHEWREHQQRGRSFQPVYRQHAYVYRQPGYVSQPPYSYACDDSDSAAAVALSVIAGAILGQALAHR